jgi:endonuclease YncB( thermonuclease family)
MRLRDLPRQCDSELALGQKAKARLEQLIASGTARIVESGKREKWGRTLAVLTVNGEDVAAIASKPTSALLRSQLE